jgi:hypothetical protein
LDCEVEVKEGREEEKVSQGEEGGRLREEDVVELPPGGWIVSLLGWVQKRAAGSLK